MSRLTPPMCDPLGLLLIPALAKPRARMNRWASFHMHVCKCLRVRDRIIMYVSALMCKSGCTRTAARQRDTELPARHFRGVHLTVQDGMSH
jgi:hypothetical protein